MAKIKCKCGEILSNSERPDIVYKVFSDEEWIDLMGQNIKDPTVDIRWPKLEFWKCYICERIHFFEEERDQVLRIYSIEDSSGGPFPEVKLQ